MATSLNSLTGYQTNKLAYVYNSSKGSGMPVVGTLNGGQELKIRSTVEYKGTIYGVIDSSPTVYYQRTGTNGKAGTANAAGFCIKAVDLVESNASSGISIDCVDNTGTSIRFSNITVLTNPEVYTVKPANSWSTYSGPGYNFRSRVRYQANEMISIFATVKDGAGNTWGTTSRNFDTWGLLKSSNGRLIASLQVGKLGTSGNTSVATPAYTTTNVNQNNVIIDASDDTYADAKTVSRILRNASASMSVADVQSLNELHRMQYVIGIPPKITETSDICYMTNMTPKNNFGRCYTELFMMGNTVLSIQPCKVKYLPGMNQDQRDSFWTMVSSKTLGQDSGIQNELSGQLFEAQPDYADYINTVNLLARTMAIYLGIGDKTYMNTGKKYRHMDYSWYKLEKIKNPSYSEFSSISKTVREALNGMVDATIRSAINDDTYIHFYMTADGTSVDENMAVSTRQSGLESLFNNQLSELAQEIQFLGGGSTGISFDEAIKEAESGMLQNVAGSMGPTISNIIRYGGNYLKGGRLVFPQMLDDCSYDRSYRGSCRLVSPSGDPEAIFLNCYLPLCYLLPYVLPQMLSDNMYRYPFLARCNAKGLYHCDLAAITGLQIQRGGQDGTCWTADGLPFEIDVSFNITPLYSKLMVTNTRHPVLFMSNSALHEYLGAMCGLSFTGTDVWKMKAEIFATMFGNYMTDTVPSMLRGYYSSNVANWLRKLFTF